MKSKLLERYKNKTPEISDYYTEECDGKTHHWIHCSDGYIFPETETTSMCGFNVKELLTMIKNTCTVKEFYGD